MQSENGSFFRNVDIGHMLELRERLNKHDKEVEELKAILQNPVSVHLNMLRGIIAMPSDANIKSLYPHLFGKSQ